MKALRKTNLPKNGEKAQSGKVNTRAAKPNRVKRVRSLAPAQFVEVVEHINDGLVVLDKDWRYVYVNQKAAVMLQRQTPSDLIGKHIWTEYPEGVGQPFQLAYEKAMREQIPIVFEDHYEPWDLWFENRIYPSPDTLMILFTEITERKRTERLLGERQHLLQKILDTEPGIVYIYDLEERRNIYINRHWLSAFGYTVEETQAMGDDLFSHIFHPDDLQLIVEHHANWREASEGENRTLEYRIRSKTGEWHWLHSRETPFTRTESGLVRQILGIAQDVTEQSQLQEAVLKEKELSDGMLNSLPGIFYFYDLSGKFLRWNKNFETVSGYSADEIAKMHPLDFFDGQEKEYLAERIQQVFARGESNAEANFVTKNRDLFPYYFTGRRIDLEGQPHLIGMGIDIRERKRADLALREREKQLSSIYEAVGDVIFQLTVEAEGVYRFTSANQAFFKTTGLSREMLLGKRVDETIPEPSLSMVLQKYKEAIETRNIVRWEEVSEYPTGTLTGEVSIAPVFDDNDHCTHLVGAVHDITDRKRAEERLQLSEERYRAVVENQTEFIVRWRPDGMRTFVNDAYRRYFGLTPEQALSAGFMPLVADGDQDALQAKLSRLLSGNTRSETDIHRVIKPDGSLGWQEWIDQAIYDETGQIVEFQSVGRDITERKQTEDALAVSEAELRALFAAMNDVVLVLDRSGMYRKIAPTNPNLLYRPPEELLGKNLRDVFPKEQAEIFINTIHQVVETGQTAHIEYELTIDGRAIWFDASLSRMDEDNTLWMARDVTDRKQAEERLRQLNEELEQRVAIRTEELAAAMVKAQESDRLKSAFLATMSHELRTPLNSIIGFTGVILQGLAGPLNEEQTKQLSMTRDSAHRLLALINDVLDISKIEAGQLEIVKRPFDMRQAIENSLRVVQPLLLKKNLQLRTSIGPSVGLINQDKRRVEQLLINLVNNAIKFTERGEVRVECQIKDGQLETCVRDTGIGIKQEDLPKLFQPFQQVNTGLARSHEGTGLGLSICRHLVVAMGGEISVESRWGVGSTFQFKLPL